MYTTNGFISHIDLGIMHAFPDLLSLKMSFAISNNENHVVGGSRSINITTANEIEFKEFCNEIYKFLKDSGKYELQELIGNKVELTFDGNGGIGSRLECIKFV